MSDTNTGGTAFPCHTIAMHEGMTLRDYFAAKAIIAYHADGNIGECEHAASWSYEMADAMLKAREA